VGEACRHAAHRALSGGYLRHRPEQTVLHRTLAAHWPEFVERAEEHGGLPRFVVKEVDAYLRCGLLEQGCVRMACTRCGLSRLVAFSCKRRGFCPSCLGRRMAETAVHLEQEVFGEVPVRQWVCSLPWGLRVLLGYDRKLCAELLTAFVGEVSRLQKRRARYALGLRSVSRAHTGAVTVVQRGDSALRLNVHFHSLFPDGVYVRESPRGPLVLHALPPPSADDVEEVARRLVSRARKILARHGRTLEEPTSEDEALRADQPVLASCYQAAAAGQALTGERAGRPVLRLVDPSQAREPEPVGLVAGFNVHAGVSVEARDRARLERLCRYLLRPPLAQDRLEELPGGKLRYGLKKAWRDGTVAVVLEPLDLIARICALVPPPRWHTVRYHGVLSSHASRRREVVPPKRTAPAEHQLDLFGPRLGRDELTEPGLPRRKPWAWLLKHVFRVDMSVCPECGGAVRLLETATTRTAIDRLLAAHGLGPAPPARPRPEPAGQLKLRFPEGAA
jgi:hypothetical protein